ncbi:hypothetical protein BD779DRAFT_1489938 [Infundibulicybe gibba]|nr:hypothetical protein BD779DRAFT_1489938 [Infundibulicybe gibba]
MNQPRFYSLALPPIVPLSALLTWHLSRPCAYANHISPELVGHRFLPCATSNSKFHLIVPSKATFFHGSQAL